MKKFKIPLIPIAISLGIILVIISISAYYFIYQSSIVVSAVNNSKTALEHGQLQTAISDISNLNTSTYADNELVQAQEVAIQNFKNISNQYNTAISEMNNSNYSECITILKLLHTNNTYLNQRINNALSIANTGYAQLLYKEGIEALQAGNTQSASNYYDTLSNKYPNSPFTKQLVAYLNGTAKGTIHSLNIEISRPMISPIEETPTPAPTPQTVQIPPPSEQDTPTPTVSNTTSASENINSEHQNNMQSNSNTNSTPTSSVQSNTQSSSNNIQTPDISNNSSSPSSSSSSNTQAVQPITKKDNTEKSPQTSKPPTITHITTTKEVQKN